VVPCHLERLISRIGEIEEKFGSRRVSSLEARKTNVDSSSEATPLRI